jgi:hypothetical protein
MVPSPLALLIGCILGILAAGLVNAWEERLVIRNEGCIASVSITWRESPQMKTGNVYVTGRTNSADLPTVNPLQPTNGGAYDAFVAKLSADGSTLLHSTYLGGTADENTYGSEPHHCTGSIAVDNIGNVYLTGSTDSVDFPVTARAYDASFNGGPRDVFVTMLDLVPVERRLFLPLMLKP